jgi:putative hydrolase
MESELDRANAALERVIYLLDRGAQPGQKVRAFRRAQEVIRELPPDELAARVAAGTLQDLDGIGNSTGSVIAAAVTGGPNTYIDDLDAATRIVPGIGAPLLAQIRGELHSHSTWSDGGAAIRDMAIAARDLGHEYLAVTDHSGRLTVAHGLNPERLREQMVEVARLNEELAPFRILQGMEVDILVDGALDLPEDLLAALDVVVASVHSKLAMPAEEMTMRMVLAVSNPYVNILGHCTGRMVTGRGRPASRFDADLVFAACAAAGTAVEVNCRPERQDPPEELLAIADDYHCDFAVNCDAHSPGQLEWQASGCDKLVAAGISADRVLNTYAVDRLLERCAA